MLRFGFSLVLAFMVTTALFLLMYRLVNHESPQLLERPQPVIVDIRQVKEPAKVKEPRQPVKKQQAPALEPLSAAPPTASSIAIPDVISTSDVAIAIPQWQQTELAVEQRYWSAPVGGNGAGGGMDYIAEVDTGRKEIVPMATRRPNIPKIAYDNRINGWVLLAFTVGNDGKVKNVRVMDAEPRGIFEANAIAAVRGWIYNPYKGPERHISQRIEFDWTMYSYNMDYQ